MNLPYPRLAAFLLASAVARAQSPATPPSGGRTPPARDPRMDAFYHLGPDSQPQPGVPKGRIAGPFTLPSRVFPGTQHTYYVYVPAQYDPSQPTAVMILNDGQAMMAEPGDVQAQNVFDNLIYRREIPVLLGVFINPGRRPDQPEPVPSNWGDRTTNRADEYNPPTDKYARVIVGELMPVLRQTYNISPDPNLHAIMGASSGGCAAFGVAWFRPDDFRKVITLVGSFTDLRGEYIYPELVTQSDRKPIRIFMQDGRNDNRNPADPKRDWFYQSVRLMQALTAKGYEVNYVWGIGNHGQKQGGAVFPEMLRWLWRDCPVSTDPNDRAERSFRAPSPAALARAFPTGVVSATGITHAFLAHSPVQGKVYRIAPNGDVVGEYTVGTKGEDSWLLPNGRLLASHNGGVRELDPATGVITWEYKAGPDVEVHSCQPLPDGRVLICECGSRRLFEINRDLTVAHEIKLISTQPTHHQFRLARKTDAGTYLVAYGSDAVVRELDADGHALRTFVLPPAKNPGVNGAFRLPNGNTLVTGGYGVAVYEFDSTARIVWTVKQADLPADFKLHYLGTAQRLPNGNTIVSNFLGLPEVFEVTADKRVVWQYHNEKIGPVSACSLLGAL